MKKKVIMLSCIAAVAIATFVGTKTLQSNAYESGLLAQNVEALSQGDTGEGDAGEDSIYIPCEVYEGNTCSVNVRTASGSGVMDIDNHRNI
ncbi:NVEALA domain-containing protein [Prevotella sp. lc2012]|uniref:NVEALA domain-containing protein n=1 Tax=Prevotella sp. lc2012 TaxID=1761886 RepID=UPI000B8058BF|nr:NVEALA domain-containing protein [Prevotella sp. lc2012]